MEITSLTCLVSRIYVNNSYCNLNSCFQSPVTFNVVCHNCINTKYESVEFKSKINCCGNYKACVYAVTSMINVQSVSCSKQIKHGVYIKPDNLFVLFLIENYT
ncbi:hypothetical protein MAR_024887 [Mya arenaria]|uniref:Uncharacterized protein n=1 Tax=Mya arenaria TaxID=6604 RepID=A0ABY7DS32_MYAAR|nr:hypothetical protein MAR_024887 [Mya arenaria]